ncbi:MAG: hypothetical protein ACRD82_05130 [Blastocatellia bacterium]
MTINGTINPSIEEKKVTDSQPINLEDKLFNDDLRVHTSSGGTQYVKVLDIFLNDRIFGEMNRLSKMVGLLEKEKS